MKFQVGYLSNNFIPTLTIMIDLSAAENQILCVTNFQELVSTPFHGEINAICWPRTLTGNFSEIVKKIKLNENIATIEERELLELQLSESGQVARDILLDDLKLLKAYGASPILNLISHYERDETYQFFPTDV